MLNKHILIVGADTEAGKACAVLFADRGWKVSSLCDTSCGCGADFTAKLNERACVGEAVGAIESQNGPIGVLFVSVPFLTSLPYSFVDTPMDWWQKCLDAWLISTANLCFHVGKAMTARKEGRIALLSPDFKNVPGDCIMEAAAAGTLHAFVKCFGAEIAKDNVLVNVVSPNIPLDLVYLAETVHYLAESDTYTAAQVLSLHGKE